MRRLGRGEWEGGIDLILIRWEDWGGHWFNLNKMRRLGRGGGGGERGGIGLILIRWEDWGGGEWEEGGIDLILIRWEDWGGGHWFNLDKMRRLGRGALI